jgi:hypothetical protein
MEAAPLKPSQAEAKPSAILGPKTGQHKRGKLSANYEAIPAVGGAQRRRNSPNPRGRSPSPGKTRPGGLFLFQILEAGYLAGLRPSPGGFPFLIAGTGNFPK